MASTRASTSAISLDDWDSLAPLSSASKASIASVGDAAGERPLPHRLARAAAAAAASASANAITPLHTRPGTPLNGGNNANSSTNLLRRATSRVDLSNISAFSSSSNPGTPRPRSPAGALRRDKEHSSPVIANGERHHVRSISTSTAASALGMSHLRRGSTPGLGGISTLAPTPNDPLEVTSPIETTQQFLDWFTLIETSMEGEQEEVFRRFSSELSCYISSCTEGIEMLEDSRGLIKEMEANYRFVEENSRSMQIACEQMLADQKHLLEVEEKINARLEYFKELDKATRALSQPGDSVVLQEDFLNMLERLDVCLEFLRANRNYRDAEVYIIRFQQCLTRAMTLIKMFFLQTLKLLQSEISEKLSQNRISTLSETALHALMYSKFSGISQISRTLLYELEKRASIEPEEYGSLLSECFSTWFSIRSSLLGPQLAEEVRRMDIGNSSNQPGDLVKLARQGCAYFRSVCLNEFNLFREFFSQAGEKEVYRYLESLCDYLHDSLRPRILHEPKLEVLCELCNVLQALMSLDGDPEDDEDQTDEGGVAGANGAGDTTITTVTGDESSFDISIPKAQQQAQGTGTSAVSNATFYPPSSPPQKLRFSALISSVLQDTQTRLVFRAQYVIEAEVLNYVPKPDDLEYPEKLKLSKENSENQDKGKGREVNLAQWQRHAVARSSSVGEEEERSFKLPPEEIMQDWYPTLRKTLWVLERLHSYVNPAIFQDFAGEAVTLCRQSLVTASEKIASRPNASKLDGQLFVIRHLLILKEMVRSLDLVQRERNIDWGTVTDALSALLRNTSTLFNPNALYQLASRGLPTFAETMRDSKRDLDSTLKLICEDFMTQSSLLVCSSIRAYLTRCQAFLSTASANTAGGATAAPGTTTAGADLPNQPWATAEEVVKLHDTFLAEGGEASMDTGLMEVLSKMTLFLDDPKTINVLLPPTQAEVLEHYTTFFNLVREEYDWETARKITPPARVRERLKALAAEVGINGDSVRAWEKSREG